MATASTVVLQDRIALLGQAIDLCQSLGSVLQLLGPKQSSDIFQRDEPSSRHRQIRTMESTLDRAFRAAIEARNQVLAPVSRLTDDVLRLLFLHSQSDHDEASSLDTSWPAFWRTWKLTDHPYNLASVCRRWRNAALDTAPLWSWLYLKAPTDLLLIEGERDHPRFRHCEAVMKRRPQLSLLRSRETLLTVEIEICGPTSISALIQYFSASFTNRVKALSFSVNDFPSSIDVSQTFHVFKRCIESTAATLTKLSLGRVTRAGSHPEDYTQVLHSLFSTELPRLQEAHFNVMPLPNPPQFAILASCRVLSMHCSLYEHFTWRCCEALFTTCQQLEDIKLTLSDYDESIDSGYSGRRIDMPRLHSFTANYNSCDDVAFPFPMLRLPNLRALDVNRSALSLEPEFAIFPPAPDRLTPALLDAIENLSSLESLSVANIPPQELHKILPRLDSVRKFKVAYGTYDSAYIQNLYIEVITVLVDGHGSGSSASFLLPALQTLALGNSASIENLRFLHDILEKRKAGSLPIRALRLCDFSMGPSVFTTSPSLEEACAMEEKVASLLDSFSITVGNWHFDKMAKAWEQHGSTHASYGMRLW